MRKLVGDIRWYGVSTENKTFPSNSTANKNPMPSAAERKAELEAIRAERLRQEKEAQEQEEREFAELERQEQEEKRVAEEKRLAEEEEARRAEEAAKATEVELARASSSKGPGTENEKACWNCASRKLVCVRPGG